MLNVVEAELEHPEPDVGRGQVHQLAAVGDPGQPEVRSLFTRQVQAPVPAVGGKRDLGPLQRDRGHARARRAECEAEQQAAAVAAERDAVEQREARDRYAEQSPQSRRVTADALAATARRSCRSSLASSTAAWRASTAVSRVAICSLCWTADRGSARSPPRLDPQSPDPLAVPSWLRWASPFAGRAPRRLAARCQPRLPLLGPSGGGHRVLGHDLEPGEPHRRDPFGPDSRWQHHPLAGDCGGRLSAMRSERWSRWARTRSRR